MKKPIVAFTISFFLPGFGLAYLGRWKWCFINLGIVIGIALVAALLMSDAAFEEAARYIRVVCASASGGIAMVLAERHNAKLRTAAPPDETPPNA